MEKKTSEVAELPDTRPSEGPPSNAPHAEESPRLLVNLDELRRDPANVICPRCRSEVTTRTALSPGTRT